MKCIAFISAAAAATVATAYNCNNPSNNARGPALLSRRHLLQRTALVSGSAVLAPLTQFAPPSFAKAADDVELIKTTCAAYKSALSDKAVFVSDLSAEGSTVAIPAQIPAITFQDLAKIARSVEGKIDADDFPFVAVEYAEHAGAARDFAKLSKLGRIGENGSAEVAAVYAEKCAVELEEAAVLLEALREAVE